MPRIITVQFDYQNDTYALLLKMMEYSVKRNMPNTVMDMVIAPAPPYVNRSLPRNFTSNTKKLEYWVKMLNEAKDGEEIILMDCDMLLIGDISCAFKEEFDIGYTFRERTHIPMNGGVIFLRVNERSREFIRLWKEVNDRMFRDDTFHRVWRSKYSGMNQAAFGCLYETITYKADVKGFPCSKYNIANEEWAFIGSHSLCLHIKSGLRKLCIEYSRGGDYKKHYHPSMSGPFEYWKTYYHDMQKLEKKQTKV